MSGGGEDNIFKDVYGGFLLGRVGFIKENILAPMSTE